MTEIIFTAFVVLEVAKRLNIHCTSLAIEASNSTLQLYYHWLQLLNTTIVRDCIKYYPHRSTVVQGI